MHPIANLLDQILNTRVVFVRVGLWSRALL